MNALKQVTILLVEDDPGDQKLIKTSLLDQKIANNVCIAESGEEALDWLSCSKANDSDHSMPNLILLDLNMPGMGGKEFLKRAKADDEFKSNPVVILTTSDSEKDIIDSYNLQAAGYIKKPVTMIEFQNVISKLEDYWFIICKQVANKQMSVC